MPSFPRDPWLPHELGKCPSFKMGKLRHRDLPSFEYLIFMSTEHSVPRHIPVALAPTTKASTLGSSNPPLPVAMVAQCFPALGTALQLQDQLTVLRYFTPTKDIQASGPHAHSRQQTLPWDTPWLLARSLFLL